MKLGVAITRMIPTMVIAGCVHADVPNVPDQPVRSLATPTGRWNDPAYLADRTDQRVAMITDQLRREIASGLVRPAAANELAARKDEIAAQLAEIGADGIVTTDERDRVRRMVRELSGLAARYAIDVNAVPRGGGPTGANALDDEAWWY
jgi:hypothetical protein